MTDVRIYCDHDDHAPKEVHVRTLRRTAPGVWGDVPLAHALKMSSGETAGRWIPETPFQIMEGDSDVWARWDFRCELNRRHNCPARQENLFPALDHLADAGLTQASLSLLAATLKVLARVRPEA